MGRRSSVVRLVLALLAVFIAVVLRDVVMTAVRGYLSLRTTAPGIWLAPPPTSGFVTTQAAAYSVTAFVVMAVFGFGAYVLYSRAIEQRFPSELRAHGAGAELGVGIAMGFALVVTVVGVLAAGGYAHFGGANPSVLVVPVFAMAATAACMEELVIRGIVYRIAEGTLGTWISLATTAALFGALHGRNPHASLISTLTIAVSAGLLLGAAYVLTRRLWLPIGLHFAVNAAQGGVFGLPVSGQETHGVLAVSVSGPAFLTGGAFGIEASAIVLVLGLSLSVIMLRRAARLHRIVPPVWRRDVTRAGT